MRSVRGSSPLTRGKRIADQKVNDRGRLIPAHAGKTTIMANKIEIPGLIPAHAGKTSSTSPEAPPSTAHPRSRGENPDIPDRFLIVEGSSPLTRGKLLEAADNRRLQGLIPAHAGKTPRVRPMRIPRPAHPRSRGENVVTACLPAFARGSSPLTRGKHPRFARGRTDVGLIPAHAGKT